MYVFVITIIIVMYLLPLALSTLSALLVGSPANSVNMFKFVASSCLHEKDFSVA